ncbi:uncharacterized protein PV07_06876 [Cladophialophora immunda]|uniref:Uncharacterized protein n=1 Tax=Cladophialophora immunda TaxID=569365 RepID=A0A0D1ZGR4_9EURO|nr:uncharacterized protein PV07_06876 [Cladophialophora immunda]KIW27101.1 hypothetical protein PV07_06876 [Cladophialophora immunda]
MKVARTLIQPIRSLTAVPFAGVKPSLRRQIRDFNRNRCHFTRVKPIEPLSNSRSPSPSRTSRKRKQFTPERFERQYEKLDHLVPLDANHSKFLSDLAEPSLFLEKDFDALQEVEEARRPLDEDVCRTQLAVDDTMEVDNDDIVMADDEEPEDVEMTDAWQPPHLVYWQGECPPPEFFFPFPPPPAGADILQQAIKAEGLVSTVACNEVTPEPPTKDEVIEYFENLEHNIANGILPPNIATEAMDPAHPPAATLRDEKIGNEHAEAENNVASEGNEREPEPGPIAPTESKAAESPVKTKTVSLSHVPEQYRGFLEEAVAFSAEQKKPPPEWWKSIALNNSEREKKYMKCEVRSVEQYAAWPPHLQVQPQFHCPDPKSSKGEFNTPASCRLGLKRNKEERQRFSEIRKNHPEVWEAIIGTMLQEGVSIDSMLLCHEAKDENGNTIDLRPQVLDNQKWCVDNWRFDSLSWHTMQDAPLPSNCSPEFHKAPKGDERLFHETIGYLKSHPEICYVFRILVSEWLKVEANKAAFRRIARKAGWCPAAEHQLQRDFVKWVFADADATSREIFELVESHFPDRYPRFFAATIEEEGIDYL